MNYELRSFVVVITFIALSIFLVAPSVLARTLRDQAGRTVNIPDSPQRVVSLAPAITEVIFSLGMGGIVKGTSEHSDFPSEAKDIPRVGSYVRPDLERIISLKPDLCIATKDGNPKNLVERLESLGIPVYVTDPRDMDGIMDMITALGDVLSVSQRAKEIVSSMRNCLEMIKSALQKNEERPGVFYQIGIHPLISAGSNTFSHQLIELAGGKNVLEHAVSYPHLGKEDVIALKPDVIIITTMEKEGGFKKIKKEWEKWPMIPAVKNKRVHIVNANLFNRPTPRIMEGILTLSKLLHPELNISCSMPRENF